MKKRKIYLRLFYHGVRATWDRAPLLTEEVEQAYALIRQQCATLGAKVNAIGGVENQR